MLRRLDVSNQRDLIAASEIRAPNAVLPDLLGQFPLVERVESQPLEESGSIREGEHPPDAKTGRLLDACIDQRRAKAAAGVGFMHRQRTNFRQVFPVEPQRAHSHDLPLCFAHHEISEVLIHFVQRPM
jgi:hypothetical protein